MIDGICKFGLVVLMVAAVAGGVCGQSGGRPGEGTEADVTDQKKKRIERLLDRLRSGQRQERLRAENRILQLGPEVIPFLERRIRQSKVSAYYELLLKFRALHDASGDGSPSKKAADSFSVERERERMKTEEGAPEQGKTNFLKRRYRDALDRYREGRYEQAERLAKAILELAPEVSFRDRIERFLVRVRERIMNSSIVVGGISTDKYRYQWGEIVHVRLSLRNASDDPLKIFFGPPPEDTFFETDGNEQGKDGAKQHETTSEEDGGDSTKKGKNGDERRTSDKQGSKKIFMEIIHEETGIFGNSVTQNRHREIDAPQKVNLEPGKRWTKHVILKTSDYPKKSVLRRFRVRARVRPSLLITGDRKMSRWITFREVTFEVYPNGMRRALPSTPEKIKYHLRSGNLKDVFFLTQLLPSREQTEIVTYFLEVLPHLNDRFARTIMVLLRSLTDQNNFYKKEKWLKWGHSNFDIETRKPKERTSSAFERYFNR